MPPSWESLLQTSKITKDEMQQNPQAVLDALNYYTHGQETNYYHQKFLEMKSAGSASSLDSLSSFFSGILYLISVRSAANN